MKKPILFTGARPTGMFHIANYFAAIHPFVKIQDNYENYLCIVDYHAITTPYDPKKMPENIKQMAIDYLSSGTDPEKTTIFVQSHIYQHLELMWILNTLTSVGELQRMTQYKEFKSRYKDTKASILNYPILMAADILLYKANFVSVGDDQTQHLELTRDIAKRFNKIYADFFPIPELAPSKFKNLRIKALNNPKNKMSKSLGPKSYIALDDSPDAIKKKINSAVTDTGEGTNGKMSPGVESLFLMLKLTANEETYQNMLKKYQDKNLQYSELKAVLAESIIEFLKPIQERRKEIEKDLGYVAKILSEGSEKARQTAEENMKKIKKLVGLL